MKYLGKIVHDKDLVTKEYVHNNFINVEPRKQIITWYPTGTGADYIATVNLPIDHGFVIDFSREVTNGTVLIDVYVDDTKIISYSSLVSGAPFIVEGINGVVKYYTYTTNNNVKTEIVSYGPAFLPGKTAMLQITAQYDVGQETQPVDIIVYTYGGLVEVAGGFVGYEDETTGDTSIHMGYYDTDSGTTGTAIGYEEL